MQAQKAGQGRPRAFECAQARAWMRLRQAEDDDDNVCLYTPEVYRQAWRAETTKTVALLKIALPSASKRELRQHAQELWLESPLRASGSHVRGPSTSACHARAGP